MYDFLEDILQRVSKRLCLFEHVFKFDVSVQSIGYAESLSLSKKVSLMFCFFSESLSVALNVDVSKTVQIDPPKVA